MKKIYNVFRDLLTVCFVLAVSFGFGYYIGENSQEQETVVVEKLSEDLDMELPLETEKRVVTVEEVESKLYEIGELSTFSGEYTCTLCKEETRYLMENLPILGTTNTIEITCNGIVKVGYDLNEIAVRVDDEKIYISIPEAKLNDNYVIWDSLVCNESNSILNPIEFSQYKEMVEEIEEKGLEDVTSKGVYQSAEDNLKKLIRVFLEEFSDYTVVFM